MKSYKVFALLALLLGPFHLPVEAATVEDLFTVELPVADQTTSLRLESFSQAFRQVAICIQSPQLS